MEIITDNYSIYQGNCLEVMDDIKDESIDLIITDPPYLIDYQSNRRKKDRKFIGIELDENYFEIAKKRLEEAKQISFNT